MLKEEYKEVTEIITHKKLVKSTRICDVCNTVIFDPYWKVLTHHSDWGNDSVDSFKNYDCCSPACVTDMFEKYMQDSNSRYNTKTFEVEHIPG